MDCRYFPPGPRLLSQPKRSLLWTVPPPNAWWQRHTGVSSLPKANDAQPGLVPTTCESHFRCQCIHQFICIREHDPYHNRGPREETDRKDRTVQKVTVQRIASPRHPHVDRVTMDCNRGCWLAIYRSHSSIPLSMDYTQIWKSGIKKRVRGTAIHRCDEFFFGRMPWKGTSPKWPRPIMCRVRRSAF